MPDRTGPPPVRAVATQNNERALTVAQQNYLTIVDTLRANNGADAKAIKAMFGGDKALMDRFLAVAFNALTSNPDLLVNCDPMSIVQAVKDSAALGLEPTGLNGEGYIIAYGRTAQFQAGWRGYLKRIRNSGKVQDVDCQVVFMNDQFSIRLGTDPMVEHVPILVGEVDEENKPIQERGDYRGVYAWALMASGKYIIEYMTTADINAIRDRYSQGYKRHAASSPWTTAWPAMARKTVIRRLAQRLPGEAVDQLLLHEARNDQAAEEVKAAVSEVRDGLKDVRQLALTAASGQAPPAPQGTDGNGSDSQGGSTTERAGRDETAGTVSAAGDGPDQNPPAAAPPTGEQCASFSPYGDNAPCVRSAPHDGVKHRDASGATW